MDINMPHAHQFDGQDRTNYSNLLLTTKAIDFILRSFPSPAGSLVLDEKTWQAEGEKHFQSVILTYDHIEDSYEIIRHSQYGTWGIRYLGSQALFGFVTIITPKGERQVNLKTLMGDSQVNILLIEMEGAIWCSLNNYLTFETIEEAEGLHKAWEGEAHSFLKELRDELRRRTGSKEAS